MYCLLYMSCGTGKTKPAVQCSGRRRLVQLFRPNRVPETCTILSIEITNYYYFVIVVIILHAIHRIVLISECVCVCTLIFHVKSYDKKKKKR